MRGTRCLAAVASGAMEFAWTYAWATFLSRALFHRTFPLPEAVLSFAAASALTALSAKRGWRVIGVLALQAAALIPAARWMARVFGDWGSSLPMAPGPDPVSAALVTPEWLVMLLVLFWGLVFWGGGVAFARRGADYTTVCRRFDLGLTALVVLLLIDFALVASGARPPDHSTLALFPAFFVTSLLAIGAARDPGQEDASFLPGYGTLGIILSFVAGVLLLGVGLIFSSLPFLGRAADAGYGALKLAGARTVSVLESAVLWLHGLFGPSTPIERALKAKKAAAAAAGHASQAPASPLLELIGRILVWFVWVLLGAVILLIAGALLYCIWQWLVSRTEGGEPRPIGPELGRLWRRLRETLAEAWERTRRRFRPCRTAVHLYEGLVGWGAWSGVPRVRTETPREYALRLDARFPQVGPEVASIVEAFHEEVYAGRPPGGEPFHRARAALGTLRKPSLWPARLKARFSRGPA